MSSTSRSSYCSNGRVMNSFALIVIGVPLGEIVPP